MVGFCYVAPKEANENHGRAGITGIIASGSQGAEDQESPTLEGKLALLGAHHKPRE